MLYEGGSCILTSDVDSCKEVSGLRWRLDCGCNNSKLSGGCVSVLETEYTGEVILKDLPLLTLTDTDIPSYVTDWFACTPLLEARLEIQL